jgi:DEAD/DEAH box helicase domain-containing protein
MMEQLNQLANRNIVFFDLETQRSFDDVGGRRNFHKLGLSVAVTFNTDRNTYESYLESEVNSLIDDLRSADLVVGFNIIRFDYIVLQPYTTFPLNTLSSFDILNDIHSRLGHRVSLDSLAQNTLYAKKSADGLQAIQWYREGQFEKLTEYCRNDVEITKQLYEYGKKNKYVVYYDRYAGAKRRVNVNWP